MVDPDHEHVESQHLKAKLGEVLIERDLLAEKIAILEAGHPLARTRPDHEAAPIEGDA